MDINSLQKKLKAKMRAAGISVHALEKQAGLKRSAVQNILQGRSKKPSAAILQAVATTLDCSITEFLNETSQPSPKYPFMAVANEMSNYFQGKLYLEAVQIAGETFEQYKLQPTDQEAFSYIQEIYKYSIDNDISFIDKRFVEWLITKQFNLKR